MSDVIVDMSPNEVGDLHLDIAESYMSKGIYKKARSILSPLVKTANYNLVRIIGYIFYESKGIHCCMLNGIRRSNWRISSFPGQTVIELDLIHFRL